MKIRKRINDSLVTAHIDEITFHLSEIEKVIYIRGWSFSNTKKNSKYSVEINGVNYIPQMKWKKREDVIQAFQRPPQSEEGFELYIYYTKESVIENFKLIASNLIEQQIILNLNDKEISQLVKKKSFTWGIDQCIQSNFHYYIEGFAYSGLNHFPTIQVLNKQKQRIDYKMDRYSRLDICDLHHLPENTETLGFKLFVCSDENQFDLELTYDGKKEIIPFCIDSKNKKVENPSLDLYDFWFRFNRISSIELEQQKKSRFVYNPKISIVVSLYNTPIKYLKKMISTVQEQSYTNWELCMADGSENDISEKYIKKEYKCDSRIHYKRLKNNYGIAENTNEAIRLSTGDYIGFYDHDDFLEKNALFEIVKVLQGNFYDVIYTDEDKYDDATKTFCDPHFKPDFNYNLFCSHNYITHFFVVRKEILDKTQGLKKEYDGAQDYDLMFRIFEITKNIYHLPKILYHWRMHSSSTALDPESKIYCYEAGKRAIEDHYKRKKLNAKVKMLPKPYFGCYETIYEVSYKEPLVSVIIFDTNSEQLKQTIKSIEKNAGYKNLEIWVISNQEEYLFEKDSKIEELKIKYENKENNLFNLCASKVNGEYILFLESGMILLENNFIEKSLGIFQQKNVGIVGSKLIQKNQSILETNYYISQTGLILLANQGIPLDSPGYMMRAQITANYSALSSWGMIIEKSLFLEVGGFEDYDSFIYRSADLCLKVRKRGYKIVYNPFLRWEALNVSLSEIAYELKKEEPFYKKWKKEIEKGDPYYNVNFAQEGQTYTLKGWSKVMLNYNLEGEKI